MENEGKVLAINHLDVESTCNLWRVHFGFYPTEKVDLVMTKKQFLSIQQKTLSSVKSVYELFYERNFIPREFEANEEPAEWGMYRNKEIEELKAENAALRERLDKAVESPVKLGDEVFFFDFDKIEVQQGKVIGIRWNYFTPSNPVWVRVQYDIPMIKKDCDIEVWLSMVFTSREAAEARLKEPQRRGEEEK